MTPTHPAPDDPRRPGRPLRADARRNRERIVAAARAAFIASGGAVPLDDIAREAGVGIGTLYRHFPTREALVEAVYAAELDTVTDSAHRLLAELPPDEALRAWMERYARFAAAKHGTIDTLRAGWAAGRITAPTRERVTAEIRTILVAGAESGALRADVDPEDVTTLLLGTFQATATGDPGRRVEPLLALIVDALRPRSTPVTPGPRPPSASGGGLTPGR